MAEEEKAKLIEPEEVNRRVEGLRKSVAEMADYVKIEDRRRKLAHGRRLRGGATEGDGSRRSPERHQRDAEHLRRIGRHGLTSKS